MGILIDSSVLIQFERSGADIAAYVAGREEEEAFVSVTSAKAYLFQEDRTFKYADNKLVLTAGVACVNVRTWWPEMFSTVLEG